ncbi:hypothetical protein BAU07_10625 [Bordetella flabilis]|uniref:Autotransporter domain-containing protein n=1 Tax=Bordetella flabilis TaxID=463014 RepID=A0A193GDG1_9BORD|nr:hypothetical protein BAU07_10625 [Bordetella flabilis]
MDASNGAFTDSLKSPEVLAKMHPSLQLFRAGGCDARAGYAADIGSSLLSQTATARFAYRF